MENYRHEYFRQKREEGGAKAYLSSLLVGFTGVSHLNSFAKKANKSLLLAYKRVPKVRKEER
eukprot:3288134-Amphidinium_carterae.1